MKRREGSCQPSVPEKEPSYQKSVPQWPHRQVRDLGFCPHTKWPPGRRAPRGTLGAAVRRGRAVGWGPWRRPEPVRRERGPAQPARQCPPVPVGSSSAAALRLSSRRHGEAQGAAGGSAESRRAAGPRVRSPAAAVPVLEAGGQGGPCGVPGCAGCRRVSAAASRSAARAGGLAARPSRALRQGWKCRFHFLPPRESCVRTGGTAGLGHRPPGSWAQVQSNLGILQRAL